MGLKGKVASNAQLKNSKRKEGSQLTKKKMSE